MEKLTAGQLRKYLSRLNDDDDEVVFVETDSPGKTGGVYSFKRFIACLHDAAAMIMITKVTEATP